MKFNMFKTLIKSIALASVLVSPASLAAQDKIGFMHFTHVLQNCNEGSAEIAKIIAFKDEQQAEADRRAAEIKKIQDEIAAKARTAKAEVLAGMQQDLDAKQTALTRFREDVQKQIDHQRDTVFQKYGEKLQALVQEYGQENGYAAIFLLDNQQYGYVSEAADLTESILNLYNERYPATAAPSS